MSGLSRKLWRYGVPTALFLTGVALVIAERAVGFAWAVTVVSLAWGAYRMSSTQADRRRHADGRPRGGRGRCDAHGAQREL